MPSSQASSGVEVLDQGTQFEPRPDDQETLWNVLEIVREVKGRYLVRWEGIDPATRKPWDLSWVPKSDCTDALRREWKTKKVKKVQDRKKRRSGADPTYDPKGPRKPSKSAPSRSNSRSIPASVANSSVAGPSKSRSDSKGSKITPIVEVTLLKKRRRENQRLPLDVVDVVGVEQEEEDVVMPKKKRKRVAYGNGRGSAGIADHAPRDDDTLVPSRASRSPRRPPDSQLTQRSREHATEERDDEESVALTPAKIKHKRIPVESPLKYPPPQPTRDSYPIDPHRKIGKRPVPLPSQLSGAGNDPPGKPDGPPLQSEAKDPTEHPSQDDGLNPDPGQPYPHDAQDDYMDDSGSVGESKTPERPLEHQSYSPSSPRTLLNSRGREIIIPETLPSVISPSQPSRSSAPSQNNNKASEPPEAGPSFVRNARHDAAAAPKPNSSRALRPVPSLSPSDFALFAPSAGAAPPDSQFSAIESFTSSGKDVRGGRRSAYSQRQEEEEFGSESGSSGVENLQPAQDGEFDAIEDIDKELRSHVRDGALKQRGEQLSTAYRQRIRSQMPSGPPRRSLSVVLSGQSSGRSSSTPDDPHMDGVVDSDMAVHTDMRQKAATDVDAKQPQPKMSHNGVAKGASNGGNSIPDSGKDRDRDLRLNQPPPGKGSHVVLVKEQGREHRVGQLVDDGRAELNEVDEVDEPGDTPDARSLYYPSAEDDADEPTDELGPGDAPDRTPIGPSRHINSLPHRASAIFPLSGTGDANYSLEATGPSTQNSQPLQPSVTSPIRQLDSALGLLHRKSVEIDLLQAEVAHLRTRLETTERRYGAISAELDETRVAREVAEERANAENEDRVTELLSDNTRLRGTNVTLQKDVDWLRGLYTMASDAHLESSAKTKDLEQENKILGAQVTTGVRQAEASWQAQVRKLETELARSRGEINILTDQARRTDGEVRRRSALLPMVRMELAAARANAKEWEENTMQMGRENTRLRLELKKWEDEAMARRRRDREAERVQEQEREQEQASAEDELVWVCPWMDEEHQTKCAALLESRETLRKHFYEAGHI